MKTLKRTLMAAALGLGMLATAQASTFASSILQINNFRLLHTPGGTPFAQGDFSTLSGTNDAVATAQLNAINSSDFASTSIMLPPPNLNQQCAGPCATGPDNPLPIAIPGFSFGHADQSLTGSSIGVMTPGANALTRADAGTVSSPNDASGNSSVGTSTTFQFSVLTPGSMTVEFSAIPYLQAFVSAGSVFNTNANARMNWQISILDLSDPTVGMLLNEAPAALNQARSLTHGAPGNVFYAPGSSSYSFTTSSALLTGHNYQLTIQHNTLADALQREVPEPGTLAVLAAGLMSMSLVSRRRSRK